MIAIQEANNVKFTGNAEIENIRRRLELTSDPTLNGYIMLLGATGNVIDYMPVLGKVSSGGKRLTPPYKLIKCDKGEWIGECVVSASSDEGTHGTSNPYIFWFGPDGQYFQTNGTYMYSDKPFRLNVQPLVFRSEVSEFIPAEQTYQ